MRTTALIILLTILMPSVLLKAQNVPTSLGNASSSYNSNDLENARFELQQALNGVNQAIGEDILALLPENLGDMNAIPELDDVTEASIGFAGLTVNREYMNEIRDATFSIVSDSPMLAGISSLLGMSIFMAADPDQKKIKIDGYKALMTRDEDSEGIVSYTLQLPFGSSLMTFECDGISEEEEFEEMAKTIPVAEIVEVAQ